MPRTILHFDEFKPIVGLRWFRFNEDFDLLSPGFFDPEIVWPVRTPLQAKCMKRQGVCKDSPGLDCGCGVGGRYDREYLYLENANEWQILAAIVGWGKVALTDKTWAAEYAQPIVLFEHQNPVREVLVRAADKYVLPVQNLSNDEDVLAPYETRQEEVMINAE